MIQNSVSSKAAFLVQPRAARISAGAWVLAFVIAVLLPAAARAGQELAGDGKLRIIAFGAHPDDCELQASGRELA